jgi:hypothetical protein
MSEKRGLIRLKKRLLLKFGFDAPTKIAFTEDLSHDGLFVKTVHPSPPGSRVHIDLTMPDGIIVKIMGMSRWRKSAPPQMIHLVKKNGMGVKILKFISGEESYQIFIANQNNKT